MSKLPIPREVLAQHVAVLGKTRSGKSSVLRLLVEDLLDRKLPVCIVDPKGDWWGLKLAADGKGPGYSVVIFGGEHGDVPINESNGAAIAELFATGNRPCLIDLGGWMVGPRTRFWIDFASTLFKLTKGQRWLVVDEFHNFAPKGKIESPEAGKMLHWSNRLASEGLGKGLVMPFASQRPQKVHNDSLTSAETLIAMRVLHPSDRNAVSDWIKGCGDSDGSQVLNSLAQMERGEGWAWSPEIGFGPKRVKFPMFKTYDSFRAQTVEDAKRITGWAEVDLDEVRGKFAATIEKAKAEDPKELKRQLAEKDKRIRELERIKPAAAPAAKEKLVEVAVFPQELDDILVRSGIQIAQALGELERGHKDLLLLRKMATKINGNGHRPPLQRPVAATAPSSRIPPQSRPVPVSAPRGRGKPPTDGISRGQQKLLDALAELEVLGVDAPSRYQLGMVAGYNLTGGSGAQHIADLATAGMVEVGNGVVSLTEEGRALADTAGAPTTLDELHQRVFAKLSEGQRRIAEHLIAIYPESISRADLGVAAGYNLTGGSGAQHVADLVTVGAARIPSPGKVAASDLLFPETLR